MTLRRITTESAMKFKFAWRIDTIRHQAGSNLGIPLEMVPVRYQRTWRDLRQDEIPLTQGRTRGSMNCCCLLVIPLGGAMPRFTPIVALLLTTRSSKGGKAADLQSLRAKRIPRRCSSDTKNGVARKKQTSGMPLVLAVSWPLLADQSSC